MCNKRESDVLEISCKAWPLGSFLLWNLIKRGRAKSKQVSIIQSNLDNSNPRGKRKSPRTSPSYGDIPFYQALEWEKFNKRQNSTCRQLCTANSSNWRRKESFHFLPNFSPNNEEFTSCLTCWYEFTNFEHRTQVISFHTCTSLISLTEKTINLHLNKVHGK